MDLEDEQDTHICLRCRTTIIGLEQYVNHKKRECPAIKVKSENTQESSITSLDDNRSANQNSLSSNIEQTGTFNETTLSNFHLQQDAFFSLLELQCKISPVKPLQSASPSEKIAQSSWNKDATESGVSLPIPDLDFGNLENGKSTENDSYRSDEEDGFDFMNELSGNDESEDEYNPPNSHTGGKWKPGTRPVSSQERKWHSSPSPPPASHTKGKWLPGKQKLDHNYVSYTHADIEEQESDKADEVDDKYNCEMCNRFFSTKYAYYRHITTPYHQKRISNDKLGDKCDVNVVDNVVDDDEPKKDEDKNEAFDCSCCNRSLSSKFAYSRHVNTFYHKRRSKITLNKENSQLNKNISSEELPQIRKSPRKKRFKISQSNYVNENHKPKTNKSFECVACERKYLTQRNLVQHLLTNLHVKRAENHPCRNKLVFENMDLIVKYAPFQCGICSYYFNHINYFVDHCKSNVHKKNAETMTGPFLCTGCDYVCEENDDMLNHFSGSDKKCIVSAPNRNRIVIVKEKISQMDNANASEPPPPKKQQSKYFEQKTFYIKNKQKFRCDVCKWETNTKYNLDIHVRRRHTKEKPYKCILCSKTFCDAGSLQVHKLSTRHKRMLVAEQLLKSSNSCQYCCEDFGEINKLREHVKQFHPEKINTCKRCNGLFVLESEFTVHLCRQLVSKKRKEDVADESFGDKKETFACTKCTFKCSSSSHLLYHQVLHELPEEVSVIKTDNNCVNKVNETNEDISHNNSSKEIQHGKIKLKMVKKYPCPYCKKSFQKAALRSHLNIHTGERPYKCNYCSKAFAQQGTLYIHLKRHSGLKKFKCDQCSFAAEKPSRLKRHKLIHENFRPRTFLCDVCGAGYHDRWGLKHHMKLHFGKDHKCPQEGCNQAFRCRSELDIHMRVHTNEKPFLCDKCGYRGRSQHQLTKHRRSHTGERPFKCQFCSYSAHLSPHLQRHLRIHTGSKPYKCPYCNYTCNTQENIRKHILKTKKHEGKKVYPCRFCDFGCNTASEYKIHVLENHSEKIDGAKTDVISLLAGVYSRIDDKKLLESPIPYTPRNERQKESTSLSRKKLKKKETKVKNNCKSSEQVVYAIRVPSKLDIVETAAEQIFQPSLNHSETILLPMGNTDTIPEAGENQSQLYIPAPIDETVITQEDTIVHDAITDDTLIENSANTILIYMPLN